ncbi:monosaccharide-sensing protein 2-like protein [Carex littledalei]|uniref:Monosaccharide-sensing protein 2-like protein n=1 Tax=Carex littledalei TaxID=544730 RepID=A0A833RJW1_9POAL|nr:monosaccharide-sensing protein 2-like protein [Carex littledalei]
MSGAVLVAIAASIGNLLQGWDNATIAGAVLYIKKEFNLESQPTIEGLIVAMSLIGATIITTFSGPVSDSVGRRPMLIISSVLYFLSGLIMFWSPNVYILLLARLIDGFGIGLAVTLVPVYISETAPPEIRGLLNTLPQFTGSGGMFFSYCMIFGMTLTPSPNWRVMLGVLSLPSLLYFALMLFYLPESPRWLVSKGKMKEAKAVLQKLRGREDVSGEMALLVEGLGSSGDTSIEEYLVAPATDLTESDAPSDKDKVKLYGPESGLSWVAQPVTGGSILGSVLGSTVMSRGGSIIDTMMDPVVALLGSVHEKNPESTGSMRAGSNLFAHFGSMFSVAERVGPREDNWTEEDPHTTDYDDTRSSDHEMTEHDEESGLEAPLLSQNDLPVDHDNSIGEVQGAMGIGGGWQLAWKVSEKDGVYKKVFLHQDEVPASRKGSMVSLSGSQLPVSGDFVHASALVSSSVLGSKGLVIEDAIGPAMVHLPETTAKGPFWKELLEPGVKHALFTGVMLQILQQFSGINGVLYYTPQILEQAGVGVLLSNLGISSDSASILISAVTTFLMLPCIGVAMRLMDVSGRRSLLLTTIPILVVSLIVLVISNAVHMGTVPHAVLSTGSVIIYFCTFVMGFGPIPNILCAEIFPTRVRGICIAICALTFWIGDIIVTYSLPVMLNSIGLGGVFGIYAIVCCFAFVFVIFRVPETKGLPLEVIIEFFNVGSKGLQNEVME